MLINHEVILVVVHVVADSRPREKLDKVFQADEEASVLPILTVDLLTSFNGPFLRFVAPITVPLFHPVRVPYLQ